MAEYPTTVASYRTIENRKDIVYDSANKTTFYAEDLRKLQDEQQAVQTTVGTNPPAGTTPVVDSLDGALARIQALEDLWQSAYRVGALYFNANDSTNPATILGFGTWAFFAEARAIVGHDPNRAIYNAGAEGGAEWVDAEHWHATASGFDGNHFYGAGNSNGRPEFGSVVYTAATRHRTNLGTATNQAVRTAHTKAAGSATQDNVSPYIAVYIWERTA